MHRPTVTIGKHSAVLGAPCHILINGAPSASGDGGVRKQCCCDEMIRDEGESRCSEEKKNRCDLFPSC